MTKDPVKFLLVDDIEDNLLALRALLQRDGVLLLEARSGPEALELLLLHDVALAVVDVQMPGMDGFELAELMRGTERTKRVPIIFVTAGSRDPKRVFKGYESGAVDFLYKPLDPHALKSKADIFYELYRQRRELADVLRLNELFMGILGHDLRTPLAAMITSAQVMQRHLHDERRQSSLHRMVAAGHRMQNMIDQLLDLTRARLADGMGFARTRAALDVAALLHRAAEELRAANPGRELRVSARGSCDTCGDADRLLQLFSNITANALQHGAEGAAIEVDVDGSGADIVTQIHNAGAIPPEVMPRLFDPFRRSSGRVERRSPGLGLGLFIAQQIALAHGGAVDVVSSEEAGTTVTVRLPRKASSAAREVLIVDDDAEVRESLRGALEHEGYAAVQANDGPQALSMLNARGHRPDVVILDVAVARVYWAMQADPELSKIPVIGVPKPLRLERLLDAVGRLFSSAPSSPATAR
jgi:two-component system, sensor histidine kinase and response regulator